MQKEPWKMHPVMAWNICWSASVEVLALGEWRTTLWLTRGKRGGPDQEKSWRGRDIRWGDGKTCLCLRHTCGADNPLLTLPLLGFKASILPSLKCQDSLQRLFQLHEAMDFSWVSYLENFPIHLIILERALDRHTTLWLKIQSPWCHLLQTRCLQGSSASVN